MNISSVQNNIQVQQVQKHKLPIQNHDDISKKAVENTNKTVMSPAQLNTPNLDKIKEQNTANYTIGNLLTSEGKLSQRNITDKGKFIDVLK